MGIKYTSASSEYLHISQNLINSDVFTWCCWFYLESQTGNDQDLLWSGDSAISDLYHRLQYDDSINDIRFSFRNGTTNHAITTTNLNIGAWNHILAYRASATDAQSWVNADDGGSGSNTTNVTGVDAGTDSFAVGMARDDTPTDPNDGVIAEVAIWNVALEDAADRQALANGISPLLVRPDDLVLYMPCLGIADLSDRLNPTTLAAFNTPISGIHPPIVNPTAQILQFTPPVITGIDTVEKRYAVMGLGRPYMRVVFPVATPDEEWRMSVGNVYGGNALSPPVGGGGVLSLVQHGGLVDRGGLIGEGGGLAG